VFVVEVIDPRHIKRFFADLTNEFPAIFACRVCSVTRFERGTYVLMGVTFWANPGIAGSDQQYAAIFKKYFFKSDIAARRLLGGFL
jgi:hypothetical protein